MSFDVKTNITSCRKTLVTDGGDEIDVLDFLAHLWKHDPQLFPKAIGQAWQLVTPTGVPVH